MHRSHLLLIYFIFTSYLNIAAINAAVTSDGYVYTNSINSISITGYTGFQSSITIPSQINGLPVTDLAYDAFANNLTITSVTIPSSVLTIQQGNFYNCPILKSVSVSNTVSYIGPLVFNSCQQLNSITVDSGNTKYSSSNGILFN